MSQDTTILTLVQYCERFVSDDARPNSSVADEGKPSDVVNRQAQRRVQKVGTILGAASLLAFDQGGSFSIHFAARMVCCSGQYCPHGVEVLALVMGAAQCLVHSSTTAVPRTVLSEA
jgi:hypothetical protein